MKKLLIITLLVFCFSFDASAQRMGSTVKIVGVRLVAGKGQVTMRGLASDLVTNVYKLGVKKGQLIAVKVDSSEPGVTFSVFSGKGERLGFGVRGWSDNAYASGTYSIVLVVNRETAALARRLQYERELRKRFNDEELRLLRLRLRDVQLKGRGGTETEKFFNAQRDEMAAMEFSQGVETFKLERQLEELKAKQRESEEKVPYSLSVRVR